MMTSFLDAHQDASAIKHGGVANIRQRDGQFVAPFQHCVMRQLKWFAVNESATPERDVA